MPAILLAITGLDPQPWEERLRALAPRRDIRLWPQRLGDPADVAYACTWNAPRGLFARLPRLEAIFSLGAGVDHILADPDLPDVPVVRIVDPDLTMRMTEYVVLHVLAYHRRQRLYDIQRRERVWHEHAQSPASAVAVGVMGLGALGAAAAAALVNLGFRVAGWSRTPKTLAGIECFHGETGLEAFLRRTEILVCLLPATPATQGILDLKLLRKLKRDGAAGGKPAVAASQNHRHATQRRRLRSARARRQPVAPDRALRGGLAARTYRRPRAGVLASAGVSSVREDPNARRTRSAPSPAR